MAPVLPPVERFEKPVRPAVPGCVNEATNRHTCSNRVITAYEASLDRYGVAFDAYVDGVNGYIDKLNAYMEAVNTYTECERKVVLPETIIRG